MATEVASQLGVTSGLHRDHGGEYGDQEAECGQRWKVHRHGVPRKRPLWNHDDDTAPEGDIMQGQKVLFAGGQGPVSAPAARLLAPDNQVFAMARFSDPKGREKLGGLRHHLHHP